MNEIPIENLAKLCGCEILIEPKSYREALFTGIFNGVLIVTSSGGIWIPPDRTTPRNTGALYIVDLAGKQMLPFDF